MNIRPIPNWRDAPRMYSVWALASIATIQGSVLTVVPPELLETIAFGGYTLGDVTQAAVAFLAVTGGIGRLLAQDLGEPK